MSEIKIGDLVANGSPKYFHITLGMVTRKHEDKWVIEWFEGEHKFVNSILFDDVAKRFKEYAEEIK